MIQTALKYIINELAHEVGLNISEVNMNNIQEIHENREQGLVVSLLNVEEEKTLKNTPNYIRKNEQLHYKEPAAYLNLNVIMAFEFGHYSKSLKVLEETVDFFQSKKSFTVGSQKLIVDLQPLSFEQMNHIWSISGGSHRPSLFYKIRLLKIQPEIEPDSKVPEISTIQLNSLQEG